MFISFVFQFHKGAIRTGIRNASIKSLIYFNSIKVRLERLEFLDNICYLCHFNSIKVRLEHVAVKMAAQKELFQFHKGAIRTKTAVPSASSMPDFNSIKVRLELGLMMINECPK